MTRLIDSGDYTEISKDLDDDLNVEPDLSISHHQLLPRINSVLSSDYRGSFPRITKHVTIFLKDHIAKAAELTVDGQLEPLILYEVENTVISKRLTPEDYNKLIAMIEDVFQASIESLTEGKFSYINV